MVTALKGPRPVAAVPTGLCLLFKDVFIYFVWEFYLYVHLSARRGHQIPLEMVEIPLEMVAGNWTQDLWKSRQWSWLLSHLSSPRLCLLYSQMNRCAQSVTIQQTILRNCTTFICVHRFMCAFMYMCIHMHGDGYTMSNVPSTKPIYIICRASCKMIIRKACSKSRNKLLQQVLKYKGYCSFISQSDFWFSLVFMILKTK